MLSINMLCYRQNALQTHRVLVAMHMHKAHSAVMVSTQICGNIWHHCAGQATHVPLGTCNATHLLISNSSITQ